MKAYQPWTSRRLLTCWCTIGFLFVTSYSRAYQLQDPIDTEQHLYRNGQSTIDSVLQSQRPLFGKSTSVTFDRPTSSASSRDGFALSFQDGVFVVPFVYYTQHRDSNNNNNNNNNNNKVLERLEITFVYSKSGNLNMDGGGGGTIQAVTVRSSPTYVDSNESTNNIVIQYHWVLEPTVQLQAGQVVIMWMVIAVVVGILMVSGDNGTPSTSRRDNDYTSTVSSSSYEYEAVSSYATNVPKWD